MTAISHKNPIFQLCRKKWEDLTIPGNASPEVVGAAFPFPLDALNCLTCPGGLLTEFQSRYLEQKFKFILQASDFHGRTSMDSGWELPSEVD